MAKEDIFCEILGCGTCDLDILENLDVPTGLIDDLMENGCLSLENIVVGSFEQRIMDAARDGIDSVTSFDDTKQEIIDFLIDNYESIQSILDDEEDIDDLLNKFTTREMDIIDTLYENKRGDGEETLDYWINELKISDVTEDSGIYFNFLDTHLYIQSNMLEVYQLFFKEWLADFEDYFGINFVNI